jgi:serine/threonine-protein kinase
MQPGQMLLHYRLVDKIGEGGMGAVWRALDTTLDREVAIKVLPHEFSTDTDRLARFEREAKVLASLNHPNVASIHGLHQTGGVHFLAMELVTGESLAQRLARGPVPLEESLGLAVQIAEALEAAHDNGVVHRDLKPANIQVTADGKVKVLDFGLAKSIESGRSSSDPSTSPTVTSGGTVAGVILGTAAYMSPEQARGRPVDKRTDIWSFGCVLYESLCGRQAFAGDTISDTIAGILAREPDWNALPPETPATIHDMLRRCLRKDERRRFHDIADVRVELEEERDEPSEPIGSNSAAGSRTTRTGRVLPWAIAAGASIVAIVALWMWGRIAAAPHEVARFTIDVPAGRAILTAHHPPLALSPDGRTFVYVGRHGETTRLYRRTLDRYEAEPISGTEGAFYPFLSPDGQWIGFYHSGRLRKISIAGGAAVDLCSTGNDIPGASWGTNGRVVFSPGFGKGLHEVSASGGETKQVTAIDRASGEGAHMWPQVLPDGKSVLFTIWTVGEWEDARIAVVSLDTGERREIARGGTHARYLPSGHLVYARAGTLLAIPFDLDRLETSGNEVPVLHDLMMSSDFGAAFHAVSSTGTLVYLPGGERVLQTSVLRVDRRGTAERLIDEPISAAWIDLSPDGRQLAVNVAGATYHVWIYDLETGMRRQLTFEGDNVSPRWTPDGKRLAIYSNLGTGYDIVQKLADGSGGRELAASDLGLHDMGSWTPDGEVLLLAVSVAAGAGDLYELSPESEPAVRPLLETEFDEYAPRVSPDGRWLAYVSDSSGGPEVYVVAYPGMDKRSRISSGGGHEPRWRHDGRELFFVSGRRLYGVPVATGDEFSAGEPVVLFEELHVAGTGDHDPAVYPFATREETGEISYDVFPDGEHFVVAVGEPDPAPEQVRVVLNWFEELERLAPSVN